MSFGFSTDTITDTHASPPAASVGLGIELAGRESYASAFTSALKDPSLAAACDVLAPRIVTVRTVAGNVHSSFEVEIDLTSAPEHIIEAARSSGLHTAASASLWEVCPQAGLERPLRPSENIYKLMSAWGTSDCRLVLKPGICSRGLQSWANDTTLQTKDGRWKKMTVTLDADKPKAYIHKSENGRALETMHLNAYNLYIGRQTGPSSPCQPSKHTVIFQHRTPDHLLENTSESRRIFCFDTIEKRDAFFVKMSKRKVAFARSQARPITNSRVARYAVSLACDTPMLRLPQTALLGPSTATSCPFSSNGLIARGCELTKANQLQSPLRGAPQDDGFTGRGLLATHPRFALH